MDVLRTSADRLDDLIDVPRPSAIADHTEPAPVLPTQVTSSSSSGPGGDRRRRRPRA